MATGNTTQFYQSHHDPRIISDLEQAEHEIMQYARTYKGAIHSLSPQSLAQAIATIEQLHLNAYKPYYYLQLCYDMGGDSHILDEIDSKRITVEEKFTHIQNNLTFFEIEIARREDIKTLHLEPDLATYAHFLKRLADEAQYLLDEEVENTLSLKYITSRGAWSKLYSDKKGQIQETLTINGETKLYTYPDLRELLKNESRDIRKQAFDVIYAHLVKHEQDVATAFNMIMLDKKIEDSMRGYENAEQKALFNNQVSQSFVDSLVATSLDHTHLAQKVYSLKFSLLNITNPTIYDLHAPLSFEGIKEQTYSWEDCMQIIVDAFTDFHPEFGRIAQKAFDEKWIDSEIRPRKYGGAYCSTFGGGYHPMVLCNYKERFDDVLTVAHELGHAVHEYLTHAHQTPFNTHYPMSMAEIASLCCETVVFNHLYSTLQDPREKLMVLFRKVEDECANIFEGAVGRYLFESHAHTQLRTNGILTTQELRALYTKYQYSDIYGDTFAIDENICGLGWQLVVHFTYIFYNYVYGSGLLLSLAIFNTIKEKPSYLDTYVSILASGGSKSPQELLSQLDLDIESPDVWQKGFTLLSQRVTEIQNIVESLQ